MKSAKAWAELTCKPSLAGVGLWHLRVFLAATFLTAVLALTETRGAADLVDTLLLKLIWVSSTGSASQPSSKVVSFCKRGPPELLGGI